MMNHPYLERGFYGNLHFNFAHKVSTSLQFTQLGWDPLIKAVSIKISLYDKLV